MGMIVAIDEALGLTVSHSGGYPGYGSHVLLLPDRGIGLFAMANRTYAGPSLAVWDAAVALERSGTAGPGARSCASQRIARSPPTARAGTMYQAGASTAARDQLAMNFLLDRDAEQWARKLARLKSQVGDCDTSAPIPATGAHRAISRGVALTGGSTAR